MFHFRMFVIISFINIFEKIFIFLSLKFVFYKLLLVTNAHTKYSGCMGV